MSDVWSLWSAPQAHAEEPPRLTAVTAERTERGVRLHFMIEGTPPAVQDVAFGSVPQILLDPEQPFWTSLPQEVPVTDEWIVGVHLFRDPMRAAGTSPQDLYPVDLIAIQTDQPRQHWLVSLASEMVVDLGEPMPSQPWSARMPAGEPIGEPVGKPAASPAELGVTAEELEGMLQRSTIPSLPEEPVPPAVPEGAQVATESSGLNRE
jgi:hypothetical protein